MNAMSLRRRALMAITNSSFFTDESWYNCDNCGGYHKDGRTCCFILANEDCPNLVGTGAEGSHPMWNLTYQQTGNNYIIGNDTCPICGTNGTTHSIVWACEVVCGFQYKAEIFVSCAHCCYYY